MQKSWPSCNLGVLLSWSKELPREIFAAIFNWWRKAPMERPPNQAPSMIAATLRRSDYTDNDRAIADYSEATALCTLYPTIPLPLPLVAIERASGSVSEICLSSVCII
jgi:hypothetical protein